MTSFFIRHRSSGDILKACLLVSATFVAYWPAAHGEFIWDDSPNVADNEALRSVGGLARSWYRIEENYHFYPLMYSSFWIEYRLWNFSTTGYHLTNILLHAMGALLLYRLLRTLTVPGAWVAAAVFALHPIQVESVAWITERKNVLSGFLFLASLLAYVRYRRLGGTGKTQSPFSVMYAVSFVLFVLAMLSKTTACTLPAVALLLVWWKMNRIGRKDVLLLTPFFIAGIALGLLTAWVEKETSFTGTLQALDESFGHRCLIAGRAVWFYAGKLVYPSPLMFVYPRWQPDGNDFAQVLYPAAAIAFVVILWLARHKLGRAPLVAALCFGGTLFPALSFFDVYFMRFSFVANHFQYLSSMALIALVVAVGHSVIERIRLAWIGPPVAAIVVVVLSLLTWHHAHTFRDEETLWNDAIRKNPDAWMAHNNLGVIFQRRDDLDTAVSYYQAALEVNDNVFETYKSLTEIYWMTGDLDKALLHGLRALELAPHIAKVVAHNDLANILKDKGDLRAALDHYRAAMTYDPDKPELQFNYARTLEISGRSDDAYRHYERAHSLKPDWPEPLRYMARLLRTHPDPDARDPDLADELERQAEQLKSD